MRAIAYARVSTDEQGDNYSLASQIDACRRYAAERGMQVIADVQDTASGAVLERPGLARVRELARLRQVDVVIVYANDRLTRNVAHMLLLRDEFLSAGVALHTVARGQAQDTPEGRMFDTLESAFAEYERLKIKERTQRGKRQKAASGLVVGEGGAPYGYRFEGKKRDRRLVIAPEEAEIVRMMYRWRLEGATTGEIARRLNAMGTPPPSVVNPHGAGARARKSEARWIRSTVQRILSNPTYAGGVVQHGATVATPAIIDAATFEAARQAARLASARARRERAHFYLLSGRARCGASGYMMHGHTKTKANGRTYRYYRVHAPFLDGYARPVSWLAPAEPVEAAVWQWVVSLLDEETIRSAVAAARDAAAEQNAERDRQRATLLAAREDVQRQIDRLLDSYARGVIDEETLARSLEPRKARLKTIAAELERLPDEDVGVTGADEELLIETARAIRANIADADQVRNEDRRAIIDAMDVQATLERGEDGSITAHVRAAIPAATAQVCVVTTRCSAVRRDSHPFIMTARILIPLPRAA